MRDPRRADLADNERASSILQRLQDVSWDDVRRRLGPADPLRTAAVLAVTAESAGTVISVQRDGQTVAQAAFDIVSRRGLRVARPMGAWAFWFDPAPSTADPQAAVALAEKIAAIPADVIKLESLTPHHECLDAIREVLPSVVHTQEPTFRVKDPATISRRHRAETGRAVRRAQKAGHDVELRWSGGVGEPSVDARESLALFHRQWEGGGGLHSSPAARERLQSVVDALCASGTARLVTVVVDGCAAAFCLGALDGDAGALVLTAFDRDVPGATGMGGVVNLEMIDRLFAEGAAQVDLASGRPAFKKALADDVPQVTLIGALSTRGRVYLAGLRLVDALRGHS